MLRLQMLSGRSDWQSAGALALARRLLVFLAFTGLARQSCQSAHCVDSARGPCYVWSAGAELRGADATTIAFDNYGDGSLDSLLR